MKKIFVVLFLLTAAFSFGQQKYAMVIGNADYTNIRKLNNPVNDANDMAAALRGLGFSVETVLNGNLDQMESAVMRLKNRLSVTKNSYGFLFYAGHGVQSGGVNYLIPTGANIPSENFLRERAVSVQTVMRELNDANNELNIVVLDACRDNPFSWSRSGSRGLTTVTHQPADSIIVYATAAGSTAEDGTGRNGLFTSQLLKNIVKPGIEVKDMLNQTGAAVTQASNRQQIPAIYSQFFGTAFLGEGSAPGPSPTPSPVSQQSLYDQLENAAGTATITVSQNTTLAESVSISRASSITLRGNAAGRTVSGPGEECYILVERGVTITLENITLRGISISVEDGGALVMNDSATLTVDKINKTGVLVSETGTFTMNGGRISGGASYGVSLSGGGTFSMKGGRIENNEDCGVVSTGTFTMSGGTITGNNGSGVIVLEGRFTMSGGTIAANKGTKLGGGGVFVNKDGSFRKTGGTIYGSDGGSNANIGSAGGNAVRVIRFDGNDVYINHTVGPNNNLNY